MSLDDFIITCFCLLDEMLPQATKGQRGPMSKLADSEVMTMELVGTYLGLAQDQEVFDYFRRHSSHFFPEMARVARTTWLRQAANLWAIKEKSDCGASCAIGWSSMIRAWRLGTCISRLAQSEVEHWHKRASLNCCSPLR